MGERDRWIRRGGLRRGGAGSVGWCLFADVCKPRFIVMHDTNTRKNARVVEHLLSVDEGGWERLDGGTALRTPSTRCEYSEYPCRSTRADRSLCY